MDINTPLSTLSRVGKTTVSRLKRLGLYTAGDLLFYFPFRYEDFSQMVHIADLHEGETVTVVGKIELIANRRSFRTRKNITEALINDETGSLRVVWFNQPYISKSLQPGDTVFLSGAVKNDMLGPQMVSPSYEKAGQENRNTARLVPIYPTTASVTQKQLRFMVSQVLPLIKKFEEWLPKEILEKQDLVPYADALIGIHFPENVQHLNDSLRRLKFDELFLLQLKAERGRRALAQEHAPEILFKEKEIKEFVAKLPFTLTNAQKITAWEILQDIAKKIPMNRMVSGDVGSGKTVIAATAMYNAVLNGFQCALMAPTEILATQHYSTIKKLLAPYDLPVVLLTGSQAKSSDREDCKKKEIVEIINSGKAPVIIGTHALLTEGVEFKNLGLVVVDEQHRFGVAQRKKIKEKGEGAHFLSMTATPIPRSLALMIYGDLEISIINELPPGRKPIKTRLVDALNRQKAYDFIRAQVKSGRQVFVICPLIEAKEQLTINNEQAMRVTAVSEKKTVMSEYEKLSKNVFPDLRIGYLHGKINAVEKEGIMAKYKAGETDILVSTSVIEVGVDIPNASVMMIEGAEKFGLAQLHQFRGRVGRSVHQSFCFLFTDNHSPKVAERLQYFESHNDGFQLAEKDLEMRGPGEVYGLEQSGEMQLKLAKLTDRELVKVARTEAMAITGYLQNYPKLLNKIKEWENNVHLE